MGLATVKVGAARQRRRAGEVQTVTVGVRDGKGVCSDAQGTELQCFIGRVERADSCGEPVDGDAGVAADGEIVPVADALKLAVTQARAGAIVEQLERAAAEGEHACAERAGVDRLEITGGDIDGRRCSCCCSR